MDNYIWQMYFTVLFLFVCLSFFFFIFLSLVCCKDQFSVLILKFGIEDFTDPQIY